MSKIAPAVLAQLKDLNFTVLVVNGLPRAGKDTFIQLMGQTILSNGGAASAFSSIDPIREMLTNMNLDLSAKTPADRKLLAVVGDALEEHSQMRSDFCLKAGASILMTKPLDQKKFLFLHIREPEIIERVRDRYAEINIPLWTVQILSDRAEVPTNTTDAGTGNMTYDYQVNNNGTLEDLRKEAEALLNLIAMRKPNQPGFGRPVNFAGNGG